MPKKRESVGQFYALNIQNDYVTVLAVKSSRRVFSIIEYQVIETSELAEYLKDKKSYCISIEQNESIDEKISLASVIKNDNIIRNSILRKLHESTTKQSILFNYHLLPENQNDEQRSYQIDGVYEKEYLSSLKFIPDWGNIQSSTTNKFSLFSLSQQCIQEESYFSVHTYTDKVTILAVHKGTLIFSRLNTIVASNAEIRKMNLVEEITQTIAYVQQQFRDIKFSTIALSGAIALDDDIPEHIYMSSSLTITVLYPNTFIQGIIDEKPQHYIFSLGSIFVPKKFQFLPASIFALRQYNLGSKILLAASALLVLSVSFFAYEKFASYSDALESYELIKSRLIRLAHQTDTYSQEELQKSLNYLQISEKYLQYHPSDILYSLKPLIELQKPQELQWKYLENTLTLSVTFKQSFYTLEELYQFEKKFYKAFNNLDKTFHNSYTTKTDYTKMDFYTLITIQNTQPTEAVQVQRRRR